MLRSENAIIVRTHARTHSLAPAARPRAGGDDWAIWEYYD